MIQSDSPPYPRSLGALAQTLRKMIEIVSVYGIILASISSCAPVTSSRGLQSAVPEGELAAISLAREGISFAQQGVTVDAELRLLQSLSLYPAAPNIEESLALVLGDAGRTEEGLVVVNKLLERAPRSVHLLLSRARILLAGAQFEQATAEYERALNLALQNAYQPEIKKNAPTSTTPVTIPVPAALTLAADTARTLSVIRLRIGDEEGARCFSQFALALKNSEVVELSRHIRTLLAIGAYMEIRRSLEEFFAAQDPRAFPDLMLALALAEAGSDDLARATATLFALRQATMLDPIISSRATLAHLLLVGRENPEFEEMDDEDVEALEGIIPAGERIYWPPALLERFDQLFSENP